MEKKYTLEILKGPIMMEEGGKYTSSSLVMGLTALFFFLGVLVVDVYEDALSFNYTLVITTFFIGFLTVIGLSFLNRSPIGGSIIGLSISGTYWVGFLTGLLIKLQFSSNTEALRQYGPYALYVSLAFSTLGLFFGSLGYMTERLFVENPVVETYVYSDYWSNVLSLGKSNRREYPDIDRRMTRAHVTVRDWWRQQINRVKQAKPELIYVDQTMAKIERKASSLREEDIGDVYDIASGQRIYQGLVDPGDLLGVYRPSILNVPKISSRIGGGRRLALEELISRFLGWFIQSRALWISYAAVSVFFIFSVLNYFDVPLGDPIDYPMDHPHPVANKCVYREQLEEEWVYNAFEEWNLPMVLFLFDKHIDEFMENDRLIKLLAEDGNATAQKYISEMY